MTIFNFARKRGSKDKTKRKRKGFLGRALKSASSKDIARTAVLTGLAVGGVGAALSKNSNISNRISDLKSKTSTAIGRTFTGTKVQTKGSEVVRKVKETIDEKPTTTTIKVPSFPVGKKRKRK
jgi:hypothetical protein